MKKVVLTFGLISGAVLSVMMALTFVVQDRVDLDRAEVIGYTSMVVAFLLIFFGVRSYRDNVAGGTVRFGKAFGVGALIAVVASLCYVATWEVIYFNFAPDFAQKYQAHVLEKARAAGESDAAIAAKKAEYEKFAKLYRNPAINAAITFLEPLPVALIVSLVTAGVLSRRKKELGVGALAQRTT
ncbi:MAG TPA: DUF4199 domain-containing protein [Gemmatimonadaceae bacterium]|nr:DUF4199 domain-containing protein [Gemmatimonadaceae bacterium]